MFRSTSMDSTICVAVSFETSHLKLLPCNFSQLHLLPRIPQLRRRKPLLELIAAHLFLPFLSLQKRFQYSLR